MHIPALLKEALEYLDPKPGENFIDCTFGFGGHAFPISERLLPDGKLLGIEYDKEIFEKLKLQISKSKLQKNIILINNNFNKLKEIVKNDKFFKSNNINGVLFDLGVSSWHFDESSRGFSFQGNEPLMMNCSREGLNAEDIVNEWSKEELIRIFREYGEERFARNIAESIYLNRQRERIKTTEQLVDIVRLAVPGKYRHGRIHFATRIFQALRIVVNDELENLKKALPQALEVLEKDGRLVVISFHSLEDRIVKHFFREKASEDSLKILTKKPIIPGEDEINLNFRSRSAKLRAAIKI